MRGYAILGGTFNPVHMGHLRVAHEVRERLGLDQVLFIPAGVPPLKSEGVAPARHRLGMLRLATAHDPAFEVLDMEIEREGASYTVETLEQLRRTRADRGGPVFIIGLDAFRDLHMWYEPRRLLSLTDLAVVSRPGHAFASLHGNPYLEGPGPGALEALDLASRGGPGAGPLRVPLVTGRAAWLVPVEPMHVSATRIREMLGRGMSARYLLPDTVECYIINNGLYVD